jgi:ubiquinol-cytochrome c reductase cytochrome c1 subunit
MELMMRMTKTLAAVMLMGLVSAPALAAGDVVHPPKMKWSFDGFTGTYDRPSLQRGFQVYKEVCAACHSMNYIAYRNLQDIGLTELETKALAAQIMVQDGPNDEGEMFERAGLPSDHFKKPYANEQAARASNSGAFPPDLSLIAKARVGGADYLHALLVGYKDAPQGFELGKGMYYNTYFAGHQIAMPPPLSEGMVTFSDGTEASVDQMSRDVSHFLMWAAEPKLEARKQMGLKVMIFLTVFAGIMYAVKRKVWSNIEH